MMHGVGGHRFAMLHTPVGVPRSLVVFAQPFAEEMNKSRRLVAIQARSLAAAGCAVLVPDLQGCGDSAGTSADADWSAWRDDLAAACEWLIERCASTMSIPLWLWALRSGALLAVEAAARLSRPCDFLFWQPAAQGKTLLQQFLRLKMAGQLSAPNAAQGSTGDLRRQLAAGQAIDVAGYRVSPGLAAGLDAARLSPPGARSPGRLIMLEVSSQPEPSLALSRIIAEWQGDGWRVDAETVAGPPFWQTTEIEEVPALVATTDRIMGAVLPPVAEVPERAVAAKEAMQPGRSDRDGTVVAEQPVAFDCAGEHLVGVIHRPPRADPARSSLGVVVVVGGPQYRIGSHRQFVHLARDLAAAGHPVLRFDVRGMGDSTGAARGFEHQTEDIAAAVDTLFRAVPGLRSCALWGLCDGASAALMYVADTRDRRVAGLCLANPWARSPQSHASTRVRHHYWGRLRSPEFWAKLLRGGVSVRSLTEFTASLKASRRRPRADDMASTSFQDRMLHGWNALAGRILLILSRNDFTANEFLDYARTHPHWSAALGQAGVETVALDDADHTFSEPAVLGAAHEATNEWLGRRARDLA